MEGDENQSLQLRYLPDDPLAFFGLTRDFDRRDLKRAYNRAIRRYRPDESPEPFRLIRQAYETLEAARKHQHRAAQVDQSERQWERSSDQPPEPLELTELPELTGPRESSHLTGPTPSMAPPAGKADREETHSPRGGRPAWIDAAVANPTVALERLEGKTVRPPPDYFRAAVLRDLADPIASSPIIDAAADGGDPGSGADDSRYVRSLCEGLVAHPDDPGLSALLESYLTENSDRVGDRIMRLIRDHLDAESFWTLTSAWWVQAACHWPIKNYWPCLRPFLADLERVNPRQSDLILTRLLDRLAWRAPLDWVRATVHRLDTDDVDQPMEIELGIQWVRAVLQIRSQPPSQNETVRRRLIAVSLAEFQPGTNRTVTTQTKLWAALAKEEAELTAAFPISSDDLGMAYRITTARAAEAYLESIGSNDRDPGGNDLIDVNEDPRRRTLRLWNELFAVGERIERADQWARHFLRTLPRAALLLLGITLAVLQIDILEQTVLRDVPLGRWLARVWGVGVGLGAVWWFRQTLDQRGWANRQEIRIDRRRIAVYQRYWQPRLMRAGDWLQIPIASLPGSILPSARSLTAKRRLRLLADFLARDHAVAIHQSIQRTQV